ncbi:MAG: HdeD family acid-resistance protein [Steroidobacteraceae bacterium]|nr:HdeD family acid-resistance protein [Steroidobacteraceae bacterium]
MAGRDAMMTSLGASAHVLCRRTWWVFVIGGIASMIFGALAFVNPGLALFVLAMFFAASILVDGAFNALGALQHREKDGWWVMLLMGILGLAVGGYALLNPPVSMVALIYLVAIQAILLGVFLLMMGYKVRKATSREWILYAAGALSVLFGVLVFKNPLAGGVSIVYVIACWAVVVGALKVFFGLRVKKMSGRVADKFSALG